MCSSFSVKSLDSNYIRGYNLPRDTTYRSPHPSRLSPRPNDRRADPFPSRTPRRSNSSPNRLPVFTSSPPRSLGRSAQTAERPRPGGGLELTSTALLDLQIDESQGQEKSQRQVPPADAAGAAGTEHGRPGRRGPNIDGDAQRVPGARRRRPGHGPGG